MNVHPLHGPFQMADAGGETRWYFIVAGRLSLGYVEKEAAEKAFHNIQIARKGLKAETRVCASCGSEDVVYDAWAGWSIDRQEWMIDDWFDDAFCRACDGSTTIECKEIEGDVHADQL